MAAAAEGGGGAVLRQVLTGPERTKLDTGDDRGFYDVPRLVKHVDDGFLDQVTELYRQRIPEGGAVLVSDETARLCTGYGARGGRLGRGCGARGEGRHKAVVNSDAQGRRWWLKAVH